MVPLVSLHQRRRCAGLWIQEDDVGIGSLRNGDPAVGPRHERRRGLTSFGGWISAESERRQPDPRRSYEDRNGTSKHSATARIGRERPRITAFDLGPQVGSAGPSE